MELLVVVNVFDAIAGLVVFSLQWMDVHNMMFFQACATSMLCPSPNSSFSISLQGGVIPKYVASFVFDYLQEKFVECFF